MRYWTVNRKVLKILGLLVLAVFLVFASMYWWEAKPWERTGVPEPPLETPAVSSGGEPDPVPEAVPPEPGEPAIQALQAHEPLVSAREDFFVEYRLERDMSRGRQVELLQSVARDAGTGEAQRAAAQERLVQITRDLEREMGLENILRAKGFRDAVVFFQEDLVTVIVPQPLSEEQATGVINLVARGAGASPENVMVIGHAPESST
ncbi:MAG: SpoIIIAH-like family protein [Candidatus Desulforudis sp.]|nr:SpoIIIAH-like family protein [Desulforudis sp.]